MKEYIVTKPILNIRNSATDKNNDNFIGQLREGETIYLTDNKITGVTPTGGVTDTWLADGYNRLVSADGVRLKVFDDKVKEFVGNQSMDYLHNNSPDRSKWRINWGFVDLEIWKIWESYNTKGEGVKVAIIDTGVNFDNNDLSDQIDLRSYNYVNDNGDLTDNDNERHGTKSSGIVASNGKKNKTVYGIAPGCTIIALKIMENRFGGSLVKSNVADAFKKAREMGADIISMSVVLPENPAGLQYEIDICLKNNMVVLAAMGDENSIAINFPAACTNVLAVGAYQLNNGIPSVYTEASAQGKHIKFLTPGALILTTGDGAVPDFHDATSASTPFAAGIFALLIACLKKKDIKYDQIELIKSLSDICAPIDGATHQAQGNGILNPFMLFRNMNP